MNTVASSPDAHSKAWIEIDAQGVVLGRLAAFVASRLRGKHLSNFTPNADLGDHVVVINADKVALTGNKLTNKKYYRHSGYPGGIRERSAQDILSGKKPEELLQLAVKRMLPSGALARQQFKHLRVYCGAEHPHGAQSPEKVDLRSMNVSNTPRG